MEGQDEVTKVILDHFQDVYSSAQVQNIEDCVTVLPKLVTDDMNAELSKPISDYEIKKSYFYYGSSKSTGNRWFKWLLLSKALRGGGKLSVCCSV